LLFLLKHLFGQRDHRVLQFLYSLLQALHQFAQLGVLGDQLCAAVTRDRYSCGGLRSASLQSHGGYAHTYIQRNQMYSQHSCGRA
jgi:hypothetical protein